MEVKKWNELDHLQAPGVLVAGMKCSSGSIGFGILFSTLYLEPCNLR